jgi:hypothetical protein
MVTLVERRFSARTSLTEAWRHLAKVETWPSWAKHIRRVELNPPGDLGPVSQGTIHLSNGVKSTFHMTHLDPPASWKWAGPFLWLTVHYDHRFRPLSQEETELTFVVEAEGFGVSILGRLFGALYARTLDRAIPNLIAELERRP